MTVRASTAVEPSGRDLWVIGLVFALGSFGLLALFVGFEAFATNGRAPADLAFTTQARTLGEAMALPESAWTRARQREERFGYQHPEAWMRFTIPSGERAREVYVLIGPTLVDRFAFHLRSPNRASVHRGGDHLPLDRAVYTTSGWLYRLNVEAGEEIRGMVHFVNRSRSTGSVLILGPGELTRANRSAGTGLGLLLGLCLILLLVSGLLVALGRSTMYAAYFGYLTAATVILLDQKGVLNLLLNGPWALVDQRTPLLGMLACVLLLTFADSFLELPRARWWARLASRSTIVVRVLAGAFFFVVAFDPPIRYYPLLNLIVVLSSFSAIAAGVAALALRARQAPLFLLGWLVFATLISFHQLGVLGLHSFPISPIMIEAGILAESTVFCLALIVRNRTLMHEQLAAEEGLQHIQSQLRQARRVQERLLPRRAPTVPGLQVWSRYSPHSELSGDLYAFHEPAPGELIVLVADVTGHGLPAALDSSVVRAAFRQAVAQFAEPERILGSMNRFLVPHVGFRFVTACCARVEPAHRRLAVASAGHVPPVLLREGRAQYIEVSGTLLGFDLAEAHSQQELELQPGDRLFVYTDGLVESHTREDGSIGELALLQAMEQAGERSGAEWTDEIFAAMQAWRQDPHQTDDVSLVGLEIKR